MAFGFGQMMPDDLLRMLQVGGAGGQAGAAPAPSQPPLSFGGQPPASPGQSRMVPLPPPRPFGLGAAPQADMPMQDAQPIMAQAAPQGAQPEGPSMWDRFRSGLADNSDLLLSVGGGLMSQPGFGRGLAAGIQTYQQGEGRRAASRLADAEFALKRRELERKEQGLNHTREFLIRGGHTPENADAIMSAAANGSREALNNALSRISPAPVAAPSGYTLNPDGSASYIRGGPQDPAMREAEAAAAARGTAAGRPPEDFSLSPGQSRVSGATGQTIATAPDRDKSIEQSAGLRKEIHQLPSYKNYASAMPVYNAMTKAAGTDSKAADLDLVYGFAKILDPTSVVRESESVMVRNTASLPDWLVGTINGLNGGQRLQPQTRDNLMTQAYGRMQSYDEAFQQDRAGYAGIVGRQGMNADDVLPNFGAITPYKPQPRQDAPAAPQTRIINGKSYARGADGAWYRQ